MSVNAQRGTDATLLAPDRVTATAARTASVDTQGAAYATVRVHVSTTQTTAGTSPTISFATGDAVSAVTTAVADFTMATLTAASGIATIHLDKRKKPHRYIKLTVTPATSAAVDAVCMSAMSTLTRKSAEPSSTTGLADNYAVVI
jgi:hypothetical protein